ncbi:MAG TPA: gliding motility protein GldC [Ferruginibacter sp.]|nr:gliding motility protein GldC [Ferruginibacter sp.]HMP19799.1 gliding motility protein GldC [Ferruginibacter sp.]
MQQSTITIDVHLDQNKIPEQINWNATDSSTAAPQRAKAFCLAFWDGAEKNALSIDLWTKDMMVDEMADFYYQVMMTMADTFNRATRQQELTDEMKQFARGFIKKFREIQLKEQQG